MKCVIFRGQRQTALSSDRGRRWTVSTFDINLGGTGTTPEIVVEQPVNTDLVDGVSSTAFGDVLLASNAVRSYTIRNAGTGPLSGLSVSIDGPDAADFVAGAPLLTTLNPGQSTSFDVTFTPADLGAASAALHIANDDLDENPFDLNLTGTGVSPEIVVELSGAELTDGGSTVEFSDLVGAAATTTNVVLTIRNTGTADLTGIGTSKNGTHAGLFSTSAIPTSLQPGQSTTLTLTFTPGSTGIKTANLVITSSDLDEAPFDLALLGAKLDRTTVQSWAESFGLSGKSLLLSADDDGDLVTLLEEYAFNLDPTVPDGLVMAPGGDSGLPLIRLLGDRLQIEFLRRRSDPDLQYSAEFGSDLAEGPPDGFLPATEAEAVSNVDINFRRVIVNDSATTATHASRFGRVKLSYPEPP